MKNYDNGFRHITLFGEDENKKKELNQFLEEKGYDYEEENDGCALAVKEVIGTTPDLKTIMVRVSEEEFNNAVNESINIIDTVIPNIVEEVNKYSES